MDDDDDDDKNCTYNTVDESRCQKKRSHIPWAANFIIPDFPPLETCFGNRGEIKKFPGVLLEEKSCFKLRHFTSHSTLENIIFANTYFIIQLMHLIHKLYVC